MKNGKDKQQQSDGLDALRATLHFTLLPITEMVRNELVDTASALQHKKAFRMQLKRCVNNAQNAAWRAEAFTRSESGRERLVKSDELVDYADSVAESVEMQINDLRTAVLRTIAEADDYQKSFSLEAATRIQTTLLLCEKHRNVLEDIQRYTVSAIAFRAKELLPNVEHITERVSAEVSSVSYGMTLDAVSVQMRNVALLYMPHNPPYIDIIKKDKRVQKAISAFDKAMNDGTKGRFKEYVKVMRSNGNNDNCVVRYAKKMQDKERGS